MINRSFQFKQLSWKALVILCALNSNGFGSPLPTTPLNQLESATPWDLRQPCPLRLRGIVTAVNPGESYFTLQDETRAIAVRASPSLKVEPGEEIELYAESFAPWFSSVPGFPFTAQRRSFLRDFQVSNKDNTNYIDRIRGYISPPVSGMYTFWISSDDSSELWLSTGREPFLAKKIAHARDWTDPEEWTRYPSQRSQPLRLEQGQEYYIETLHEQNGGAEHLAVAWEGPDLAKSIVSAEYLRPWDGFANIDSISLRAAGRTEGIPTPTGIPIGLVREIWSPAGVKSLSELKSVAALGSIIQLQKPTLTILGRQTMPPPITFSPGQAISQSENFKWCEMVGNVSFISRAGPSLILDLVVGERRCRVLIQEWRGESMPRLSGATVRVRGVCEASMAVDGQCVAGNILVPVADTIALVAPAQDWDQVQEVFVSDIIQPAGVASEGEHLVKVRGSVVSQEPGQWLLLRDEGVFAAFSSTDGKQWEAIGSPLNVPMKNTSYVGFALTSQNNENVANVVFDHVSGINGPYEAREIGDSAANGVFTQRDDTIAITGAGGEIWGSSDSFYYVYSKLEGDGEFIARIVDFKIPNQWAKAGLQIRENLESNSAFVDAVALGISGTGLQWRQRAVGSRANSNGSLALPLPYWIKLVRRHDVIRIQTTQQQTVPAGTLVEAVGYLETEKGAQVIRNAFFRESPRLTNQEDEVQKERPLIEIRKLVDSPASSLPDWLRIHGVITYSGEARGKRYITVQDGTGGMVIDPSEPCSVRAGQFVEIQISAHLSKNGRSFRADKILPLGTAALPNPLEHPMEYLMPRKGEGQRVQIVGIVYGVDGDDAAIVKSRSGFFSAHVEGMTRADWNRLVDATVRVRGVTVYPDSEHRLVLVPSAEDLAIIAPPPNDAWAVKASPIATLAEQESVRQLSHRVMISGVVTLAEKSHSYMQDDSGGARITIAGSSRPEVGDRIQAVGFPEVMADNSVSLSETITRKSGPAEQPEPAMVTAAALFNGEFRGRLVRVNATVIQAARVEPGQTILLRADQKTFRSTIGYAGRGHFAVPNGSLVQVTGICAAEGSPTEWVEQPSPATITPFILLLRTPQDLEVLKRPSWWRLQWLAFGMGVLALGLGITFFWIHILRRRVHQKSLELTLMMEQLKKETETSATLAERYRLAGEIHDGLEQGLSGLMLQLEAMGKVAADVPEVREGLSLARNMASFSRTELRQAIWDLHSPILQGVDLGTALTKVAEQIGGEVPRIQITVTGDAFPISSPLDHHLFRIAQEAIANAVKHAAAAVIQVELKYSEAGISLSILDNGCGFSPEDVLSHRMGHFGLRSLRSRAKNIGGEVVISSEPGKGSLIKVEVPMSEIEANLTQTD